MYYKEGDWESVLFPCLSVRLAIVYFFLLFHISDADNPGKNRVNIYLFVISFYPYSCRTKVTIICHLKKFRKKKKSLCVIFFI